VTSASSEQALVPPWGPEDAWHVAYVGVAFFVLALTAGIGIVCTTYLEEQCDITMFGYAAADQIMLPVTSLPLVWLAAAWPGLAKVLGEPAVRVAELFPERTGAQSGIADASEMVNVDGGRDARESEREGEQALDAEAGEMPVTVTVPVPVVGGRSSAGVTSGSYGSSLEMAAVG